MLFRCQHGLIVDKLLIHTVNMAPGSVGFITTVFFSYLLVITSFGSEVGRGLCVVSPIRKIHAFERFGVGTLFRFFGSKPFSLEPFGEFLACCGFRHDEGTNAAGSDGLVGSGWHHLGRAAERTNSSGFKGIIDGNGAAALAFHRFLLSAPFAAFLVYS